LNRLQELIYNRGERLVPYVSHDNGELVRHRSSYAFFHRIIAEDTAAREPGSTVSIVDLGFGSGYGCALLSSLRKAQITGVDISPECKDFANQYYARTNVDYLIEDLTTYIPSMNAYDYVVSRGVLEHVPGGVELIGQIKYARRALVDVPYDETPGNEHHLLTGIREEDFAALPNKEIFYEDLDGNIFDEKGKPPKPNLILVALSAPGLQKISGMFSFPIAAVRDDALEIASRATSGGRRWQLKREELLIEAERAIRETDVVADIGCGIVPMNYFRPKLHFMIEPWKEYSDILSYRHRDDKSVVILRMGALEALKGFGDRSVDSIFMLDVIEHLPKDIGLQVIEECERVAREQIVMFTPLGFMPQHMGQGEADGWGLSGATVQEHLSGWTPEDFGPAWSFYISEDFHQLDFKGDPLERPHGAFFAIRNLDAEPVAKPDVYTQLRRPLPSEIELDRLKGEMVQLKSEAEGWKTAYNNLRNSRSVKLLLRVMRLVRG
jgi:hypothetical protein